MDFKQLGMFKQMMAEQFAQPYMTRSFSFKYAIYDVWISGKHLGITNSTGQIDAHFENIGGSNSLLRQNMLMTVTLNDMLLDKSFSRVFSFDYLMDNDSRVIWCRNDDADSGSLGVTPSAMSLFYDDAKSIIMVYLHYQAQGVHIEFSGIPKPVLSDNSSL